ncbi:probable receptor-like protein kinase At5g18500 [Gossypium arboreum]|uniref:Protein kinase domain-containing protein n=2 Tax=Gossypium TaxID=3633 RepID=A0ABR0QM72_GOSAR|nr:probable receptor-like protein kinase At5g18500 [Gossypium arboreum]KAK5840414.1 hypothetical protein PVK06_009314 [Gossypium arboreum]
MEGNTTPHTPSYVVIAFDATKDHNEREFRIIINHIRVRGDILRGGDTLLMLGVLHRVTHPMGYQSKPCPESFGTSLRAMEEEISNKVDSYVKLLHQSAEECEEQGVSIGVKITAGVPLKNVVLQEVVASKPAWVVLDRHLRRDLKLYLKQIPCKVALVQDSLNVDVLRNHTISEPDIGDQKVYSMSKSKPVPPSNFHFTENIDPSETSSRRYSLSTSYLESSKSGLFTPSSTLKSEEHNFLSDFGSSSKLEISDTYTKGGSMLFDTPNIIQKQQRHGFRNKSTGSPLLCVACGLRTELYIQDSKAFTYTEIQQATEDFSKKNLLGEGGYGHVYKGKLKDGQLIAAKVRKQESTQGFAEFNSEVSVLSFARHKNIVMLLGYCCKENLNILVYEYICNKSLYWHLFENTENVLDWHQRRAIAIGTAKGLRFLHEECRGGPIIHRDMRPGNILLTHDLVPMLGDFGLARWKINDETLQTKVLGTLGYLAPEYAENGFVSVRTDVYAFGIVLLQLISGRKVIDYKSEDKSEGQHVSLRQWAEPLIEKLALHELIDPRIEESYDTYQLYLMAKTAYLCVQMNPEMRPSMAEVLRLLEGEADHFHQLKEKAVPQFTKR